MTEGTAINAVEEGFRYLIVVVAFDQRRVMLTHCRPKFQISKLFTGNEFYKLRDLVNLLFIEVDALARGGMNTSPIRVFKARTGCQRYVLKVGEVGLKPVQYGLSKTHGGVHRQIITGEGQNAPQLTVTERP